MDTTKLDEDLEEAIEYAKGVIFFPLYPIEDHYDKVLSLWGRIRPSDFSRIFWESENPDISQRTFLECAQRTTLFVLGFSEGNLACAWWIANVSGEKESSRCELSAWFSFSSRGIGSEYLLRKILSYLHETLGIQSIFMRSPWRTAKSMCERAGVAEVAAIERYYIRGKPSTLRIFRSEA